MKKKFRLNNKGFVLAETLVVAVAITLIFGIVYTNFYPLMGEYERRENYDDIDSKYGTYWIKKFIQSCDYNFSSVESDINAKGWSKFSCAKISNATNKTMCYKMLSKLEVSCDNPSTNDRIETCDNRPNEPHIYITRFRLVENDPTTGNPIPDKDMKTKIFANNTNEDINEYLRYLPNYSKINSLNKAQYRIIIEYYRHRFDTTEKSAGVLEIDADNDFKSYATIEVKRSC